VSSSSTACLKCSRGVFPIRVRFAITRPSRQSQSILSPEQHRPERKDDRCEQDDHGSLSFREGGGRFHWSITPKGSGGSLLIAGASLPGHSLRSRYWRTASLTFSRSRRSSGESSIIGLWISASIISSSRAAFAPIPTTDRKRLSLITPEPNATSFDQMILPALLALHADHRSIGGLHIGLSIQRHPDRKPSGGVVSNNPNAGNRLAPGPQTNRLKAFLPEGSVTDPDRFEAPPSYGTGWLMQSHFRYPILPNRRTRGGSSRNGRSGAIAKALDTFGVCRYFAGPREITHGSGHGA
jgi:hypothetical protein